MRLAELIEGVPVYRDVPDVKFELSYDVVVAGLGTSGVMAAITCGRLGLRTLGIEQLPSMGGQGTAGGIWNYFWGVKGGLYTEIDRYAGELAQNSTFVKCEGVGEIHKNAAYYDYCEKYKVDRRFDAVVTGVYLTHKKVCGIRYFDGHGEHSVMSSFVIDCTAEGIICMTAGCEMNTVRSLAKPFQPYSNIAFYWNGKNLSGANVDGGYVNQYDPFDFSREVLNSASLPQMLRQYRDGERRLVSLSPILGLREGFSIKGEENLTSADILNDNRTGDTVFYCSANIDDHSKNIAFADDEYVKWVAVCSLRNFYLQFPVPKGVLIPCGYDGILAAGRHIASDRFTAAALRMKDEMHKTGEAAANIAALSIELDCSAKDVPYDKLSRMLYETGCINSGSKYMIKGDIGSGTFEEICFKMNREDIVRGLSSDKSGFYIYSAARNGIDLEEYLYSENPLLSRNAAFAEGLRGNLKCAGVIIGIIPDRSGYTPQTSRAFRHPHSISAIALSGILKLREAVPLLLEIISDKNYAQGIPFVKDEFIANADDLYFQYFSHSVAALIKIAREHKDIYSIISEKIQDIIYCSDFKVSVSLKPVNESVYDMTRTVIDFVRSNL